MLQAQISFRKEETFGEMGDHSMSEKECQSRESVSGNAAQPSIQVVPTVEAGHCETDDVYDGTTPMDTSVEGEQHVGEESSFEEEDGESLAESNAATETNSGLNQIIDQLDAVSERLGHLDTIFEERIAHTDYETATMKRLSAEVQ